MGTNLGRWNVACAQKNGMKNKVRGPERYLHESKAGSTGRSMCPKSWYDDDDEILIAFLATGQMASALSMSTMLHQIS